MLEKSRRIGRKDRKGRKGQKKRRTEKEDFGEKSRKGEVEGSQVGRCQKIQTETRKEIQRKERKNKRKEGAIYVMRKEQTKGR